MINRGIHKLCSRGVLYVTPVCNLKCQFCYYRNSQNREHKDIHYLKKEADRQRFSYGLDSVDLTGVGEPTTHPFLKVLVKYCNDIGLKPTIITNGQLTNVLKEIIESGNLNDLLVSVHDLGDDYDKLTQVKGSWKRMENTLQMLKDNNFKFRVNCTVTKLNLEHLKQVSDLVYSYGARMIDFIVFNPHEGTDWSHIPNADFQPTYSEAAKSIKEAIDHIGKRMVVNVRYIPLCMMKGYEQHVINFHQWIYDKYGWEESHGNGLRKFEEEIEHINFVNQKTSINYKKPECANCSNKLICDGIYPQYLKRFGTEEFKPLNSPYFFRSAMEFRTKYLQENEDEFKGSD